MKFKIPVNFAKSRTQRETEREKEKEKGKIFKREKIHVSQHYLTDNFVIWN